MEDFHVKLPDEIEAEVFFGDEIKGCGFVCFEVIQTCLLGLLAGEVGHKLIECLPVLVSERWSWSW